MCFLRYGVQQTEMFVILGHFSPFYPTNNPKNENFEKMEKNTRRSHHFTLVYHKWHPHDVWLQWYGAQKILFVIFDFFFYSLTSPTTCNYKIKKKNGKMAADIIILHLHMTTENHMTYGSWEMECNRQFFLPF